MTRVSFDSDGQCIGTDQVKAQLQFDPINACYHIMIDGDPSCGDFSDEPEISDRELEELMAAFKAQKETAR